MKARQPKKIVHHETCASLLALIEMGKARVFKTHTEYGPEYAVVSASGSPIGIIGPKYTYMFEKMLTERGSGDGLFEGYDQTSWP